MNNANPTQMYGVDHWGLAELHKSTSTVRIYDSLHSSTSWMDVLPRLLSTFNSLSSRHILYPIYWPSNWMLSADVYSAQLGNGSDCGIFTMLNAYFVCQGIKRPGIEPGNRVRLDYRPKIAMCLPESGTSFLLEYNMLIDQ